MKRIIPFSALLLLLVCCSAPKSDMDRYIDDLMSRMTLEQKIGQLNLHSAPGFISAERVTEEDENTKMLREGLMGGIYGSGNFNVLNAPRKSPWKPVPASLLSLEWMLSTGTRPCFPSLWRCPHPGISKR